MANVEHLTSEQKFVIRQDGDMAELAYRIFADGEQTKVNFYSTYVPPAYRGKGLAEALVRTGLAWAREQGYHIEASCWYVAKFIR